MREGFRNGVQELVELGPRRTAFRILWEVKNRTGIAAYVKPPTLRWRSPLDEDWTTRLPFADPLAVADYIGPRLWDQNLAKLREQAEAATEGRIFCFGRWWADYGASIRWHTNPCNGQSWPATAHWSNALASEARIGDVKLTWEAARFPQAFFLARAAAFFPERRDEYASALLDQIEGFLTANPLCRGVHWASSQETAFRLFSWIFALDVLLCRTELAPAATALIGRALAEGAGFVEQNIDYARLAIYNNHLLNEALLLYLTGTLLPQAERAPRWRAMGRSILDEQANCQFYTDGAYIQQSHNYERNALQALMWAVLVSRIAGDKPPAEWLRAMARSCDFLFAHQCPVDGRLPNYGANDGSLPSVLSTCDMMDFRPTLQAISLLSRGERLFVPGPWDEEAAWVLGPQALDAPLRSSKRRSVSFMPTGYHVLRGKDERTFSTFRCGTIRDRFSQIDMLHVDVWWRGENVLADGGSFLYNGPAEWHEHFTRTSSHSTLTVDDRDQMLYYRRFKNLYWTRARLLHFSDNLEWALCAGEHYGFTQLPGHCVHRRAVLMVKDDLWIVIDRVTGTGQHQVRLHWLAGDYPHQLLGDSVMLQSPQGNFGARILDSYGVKCSVIVVKGREEPPCGWMSRYYGEKIAVPALIVEKQSTLPLTLISLFGGGSVPEVQLNRNVWTVSLGETSARFSLADGIPEAISIERSAANTSQPAHGCDLNA